MLLEHRFHCMHLICSNMSIEILKYERLVNPSDIRLLKLQPGGASESLVSTLITYSLDDRSYR